MSQFDAGMARSLFFAPGYDRWVPSYLRGGGGGGTPNPLNDRTLNPPRQQGGYPLIGGQGLPSSVAAGGYWAGSGGNAGGMPAAPPPPMPPPPGGNVQASNGFSGQALNGYNPQTVTANGFSPLAGYNPSVHAAPPGPPSPRPDAMPTMDLAPQRPPTNYGTIQQPRFSPPVGNPAQWIRPAGSGVTQSWLGGGGMPSAPGGLGGERSSYVTPAGGGAAGGVGYSWMGGGAGGRSGPGRLDGIPRPVAPGGYDGSGWVPPPGGWNQPAKPRPALSGGSAGGVASGSGFRAPSQPPRGSKQMPPPYNRRGRQY